MNHVEQQVAIARILGFRQNPDYQKYGTKNRHKVIAPDGAPHGCWKECGGNSGPGGGACAADWVDYPLPDYPNDLNACHEFEQWLNLSENDGKGLAARYCENLEALFERDSCCWIETLGATAQQRCEAFLRTFDLWKGDE